MIVNKIIGSHYLLYANAAQFDLPLPRFTEPLIMPNNPFNIPALWTGGTMYGLENIIEVLVSTGESAVYEQIKIESERMGL